MRRDDSRLFGVFVEKQSAVTVFFGFKIFSQQKMPLCF